MIKIKKINSIDFGAKALLIILLFLIFIPLVFWGVNYFVPKSSFLFVANCSCVLGAILLFVFLPVLFIELRQDKIISEYYGSHKNAKIKINENIFECANCGNRKISSVEKSCPLCGVNFINTSLSSQEILDSHSL